VNSTAAAEPPALAVFDDLDTARKALANGERIDRDVRAGWRPPSADLPGEQPGVLRC
jgi:hypothetical protein